MAQLESFSRVSYTSRFQTLLEKLQTQVRDKKLANERVREQSKLNDDTDGPACGERDVKSESRKSDSKAKNDSNFEKAEQ